MTVPSFITPGTYTIQISITDTLYNGSVLLAITTVAIDVSNVTFEARDNLFVFLLSQITRDDFIRNHLVNFNTTIRSVLSQLISEQFMLILINIQTSSFTLNSTELTLAVYYPSTNTYVNTDLIQHILYTNKRHIESVLGLVIATEDFNLCGVEPCSRDGLCAVSSQYLPSTIDHTSDVSYLGLQVHRQTNCSCFAGFTGQDCSINCPLCPGVVNPCESTNCPSNNMSCHVIDGKGVCMDDCDPSPCKHGGVCVRQLPGYHCSSCPLGHDGPNCELTKATFNGDTHALFPSIPLVNKGHIILEFITNETEGLLLYSGNYGIYNDYIILYLNNNTVKCRLSFGGLEYTLEAQGVSVNDKKWITVILEYSTIVSVCVGSRAHYSDLNN